MSKNQFNGIVILDAIPDGELMTARRLNEDLIDLSHTLKQELLVHYFRINTYSDLESHISEIHTTIKKSNLLPWIHLEGHGSPNEDGFTLAGGETCTWHQLKELLTPLNVSSNLNIMLILATCFGGSFAKAITTTDRAPIAGLIGPIHEVQAGEVEIGFILFYKTFFETLSLREAFKALRSTAPRGLYYRTTAQKFFYDVWVSYKTKQCTKKELHIRASRIHRIAKAQNLPVVPSIGNIKRMLKSQEKPMFEKYRDTYFMYDVDASNRERYPVSYNEAEAYVRR